MLINHYCRNVIMINATLYKKFNKDGKFHNSRKAKRKYSTKCFVFDVLGTN